MHVASASGSPDQTKAKEESPSPLPASKAGMAEVRMSISTAGDRLDYLSRAGVTPRNKIRTATSYAPIEIEHKNSDNIQFQLGRMRIDRDTLPTQTSPDTLRILPALEAIPLELPSLEEAHTINTDKYLANRIASGVAEQARHHGCEFFCGGDRAGMFNHYRNRNFDQVVKISSNTSTQAHLFSSTADGRSILVLSGMPSKTRIKHQLLQLHFAKVDLDRVAIIGDVDTQKTQAVAKLKSQLSQLPGADHKILFIGCRWQVMEHLGKQLHGISDSQPEGVGYNAITPQAHNVAGYVFDTASIKLSGKDCLVAALRMPNGDMAYDATKTFLEHGFGHVVMCGAGGRIAGDSHVGDYMLLQQSQYGKEHIRLAPDSIRVPESPLFSKGNMASNITVDSPLQETKKWMEDNRSMGCVDVETAHILRALHESSAPTTVTPGLFVSDVVGAHPLEGKISTDDAYRKLPEFVASVLQSTRELVEQRGDAA
ncbi:hypothetical protein [Ralstonia solanacearum]|uniref:Nucleoside phosphorylase domain-containing protein n=2 Tax=Ralstonia solanacearum TaxID=305 RepID=F6G8X6_RALS8|nr:hypothetical protein [Ralstonia solanacearum]AEG71416.1 conserved hypothetical protein [Ralstonia solanacearum Po82]AMP71974.1 hypothetical protein UW163_21180 [Ralstonia solanacearum]MBB6589132.1 hypothetical protein [Ralstonia solanacearum]MCG3575316.1 hypothetical protein [Ralstonia solanacearum]MCL9840958.1 hypothetical protein [Ralstonia solanacearum]